MAASSLSCGSSVSHRVQQHTGTQTALKRVPNLGLGNAWTRHHHFFAGAGEGDITRPTLHRVARLDRLRHVVGLVASVLRSFERPISATSVGILRPHFGRQVRRGVGDRRARAGRSDDRSPLEGFCWRTYHQARAARSDDEGGLSGVRRVTLKPRRESPLSIADSRPSPAFLALFRWFADSALEQAGFEPSVPRSTERTNAAASDLQEETGRHRINQDE